MNNLFFQPLLVLVGLISTVFFFRYLFFSDKKNNMPFIAFDGTKFKSQKDCDEYSYLAKKLEPLFDEISTGNRDKKNLLGLKLSFINTLKKEGFNDLKLLLSYKDQFKKLSDLFEIEIDSEK